MTSFFRFLDLPIESRLMIYKEIDLITTVHELVLPAVDPTKTSNLSAGTPGSPVSMSRKTLDCSILATCRHVHQEAASVFAAKFRQLSLERIRSRLDWSNIYALNNLLGDARISFNTQRKFGSHTLEDPHMELVMKYCFAFLHESPRLLTDPKAGHDIELMMTKSGDPNVTYGMEVLIRLVAVIALSAVCNLALRIVHDGCPGLPNVTEDFGRSRREISAGELQKLLAKQRKHSVDMEQLGEEAWA